MIVALEETDLEKPSCVFVRLILGAFCLFSVWLASNVWRIVKEKRKVQNLKEREAYEHYLMISNICDILIKVEYRKIHALNGRYKGKRYKRKTLKKSCKRNLTQKDLSKLWNKLNQIRFSQCMTFEKIVYQYKELLISSDDDVNQTPLAIEERMKSPFFQSSFPEISFVPKFQSTERERNETDTKLSTTGNNSLDDSQNQTGLLRLQMLDHSKKCETILDSQSDLLVFPELPVASTSVLNNNCIIGDDCFGFDQEKISSQLSARDSGFQDTPNETFNLSSTKQEEKKMSQILHKMEEYNVIKNAELCCQIQKAQMQMKSEMGDLKTAFRLPPEDIEITRSQILDCPLLQTRKKMLHQVDKRMQIVRDEIEVSNRNSLKLSSSSQVSQTDDSLAILMRSLVWQQKHEERLIQAKNKIINSVKSAMKTRFRGMALKHNADVESSTTDLCYDCATGRHKLYFIDGVDGCDIEGPDKILTETNGFSKDCTVVRVINSWYKELELKRSGTTKEKADRMERLLNKILKEIFLKRYYERGQLISQKYLTVSSNLEQFVFISPKSSIPSCDD